MVLIIARLRFGLRMNDIDLTAPMERSTQETRLGQMNENIRLQKSRERRNEAKGDRWYTNRKNLSKFDSCSPERQISEKSHNSEMYEVGQYHMCMLHCEES